MHKSKPACIGVGRQPGTSTLQWVYHKIQVGIGVSRLGVKGVTAAVCRDDEGRYVGLSVIGYDEMCIET